MTASSRCAMPRMSSASSSSRASICARCSAVMGLMVTPALTSLGFHAQAKPPDRRSTMHKHCSLEG